MLTKIAETGTGVRCGNHGAARVYHWTAADVRACYATPAPAPAPAPRLPYRPSIDDEQPAGLAGDWLIAEIRTLLDTRKVAPLYAASLRNYIASNDPTEYGLRAAIARLKAMPEKSKPTPPKVTVPAGRYAIERDGTLKFYKVDKPTEGRWAGYTFVSVQASDTDYPIRDRSSREAILAKIAVDPKTAMERYGLEIGKCGHCGRTLTNEESRARGIGPVCANKMGW